MIETIGIALCVAALVIIVFILVTVFVALVNAILSDMLNEGKISYVMFAILLIPSWMFTAGLMLQVIAEKFFT